MELTAKQQILSGLHWKNLLQRTDIMAAVGMVSILMIMIIPLPSILLDLFLSTNITIALLILVISLYTVRATDFSIFPAILLATTLFRLALNVASTRLILLHGDEGPAAAGAVIESFGQFVVGGNYVVGVVVFAILVLINFMVITKGAGRVAEVAARFTLDAMPGKQMAIDADLNAGLINEADARKRRELISAEASFHGAMDGASKFVKGDAIAGIIITLINIGAGFIIGVLQKGMPMAEAARNYTILTVGDGLVGQVPALIISTAAGLLVTRSAGDSDFGADIKTQFSRYSIALWVVSGLLLIFALIPGFPFIPFMLTASSLALMAWQLDKKKRETAAEIVAEKPKEAPMPAAENYEEMLNVDLLELEVGYGLIPFVDSTQNGELLTRIQSIRKQFAMNNGFIVPPIHIKDNLQLNPNQYTMALKGIKVAEAEMLPGHYMAMDPGMVTETVKGIATTEPAFGLPAIWITEDKKERAQIAGYTVVDCTTVMATHISEIIKQHGHELIGRQEVQNLLDNLAKNYPKLVEELVPAILSLGTIMRILQNLLAEGVSIRDLRTILETMADWGPVTRDPDVLTEYVRHALARAISAGLAINGTIPLITLAKPVEDAISKSIQHKESGSYLAIDPLTAQSILDSIGQAITLFAGGQRPTLLSAPQIRPHVRKLTERYYPALVVLSHNEITPNLKVRSLGTVTLDAS
ncbi:MAG: flagellar biosynthesis protein FlhA [Proteobacteria bacterium]|jgi:flagellar biosynthesis protein FlhA|nr:flagellar biosynthesis protein FlhA [Desulfocapsa sp.]MBU3943820.1 flagellar biosynthesis protein FlhA [Pseudomonadota bacterium]MCG2743689.1 flagellar biosynthesis protein FlhA [Desulfobacteraceae bacterium]MBU4082987.1 flagellar biosynthesis protein FlhA [Pseudomonadota bacterium]MBU4108780.1 flagellar biosynthesis protein FlhA [Pseudomonadota bacterium]